MVLEGRGRSADGTTPPPVPLCADLYAAVLTNMTFIFALGYAISAAIPSQDAAVSRPLLLACLCGSHQ